MIARASTILLAVVLASCGAGPGSTRSGNDGLPAELLAWDPVPPGTYFFPVALLEAPPPPADAEEPLAVLLDPLTVTLREGGWAPLDLGGDPVALRGTPALCARREVVFGRGDLRWTLAPGSPLFVHGVGQRHVRVSPSPSLGAVTTLVRREMLSAEHCVERPAPPPEGTLRVPSAPAGFSPCLFSDTLVARADRVALEGGEPMEILERRDGGDRVRVRVAGGSVSGWLPRMPSREGDAGGEEWFRSARALSLRGLTVPEGSPVSRRDGVLGPVLRFFPTVGGRQLLIPVRTAWVDDPSVPEDALVPASVDDPPTPYPLVPAEPFGSCWHAGARRPRPGDGERASVRKEDVRRAVSANIRDVRDCYERVLRHRDVEGRIVVQWIIGPTGQLENGRLVRSTMNEPAVESCILRSSGRWQFPRPSAPGSIVVNYPFRLTYAPAPNARRARGR